MVKIFVRGKNLAQVNRIVISLEAESKGVIVSIDKTTKGIEIIVSIVTLMNRVVARSLEP